MARSVTFCFCIPVWLGAVVLRLFCAGIIHAGLINVLTRHGHFTAALTAVQRKAPISTIILLSMLAIFSNIRLHWLHDNDLVSGYWLAVIWFLHRSGHFLDDLVV
ncbi:hypothetical protein BD410DRAFT_389546 [Rickenella mellea]|uniref:Uncharacterized protein n=1 Tax=Rickenella mellea TaxID=50990 RepID=A0A4Y7PZS9_9AGAM|nr:hypothetical protein BD410DRAFT_389546 [Rickenella mellea]